MRVAGLELPLDCPLRVRVTAVFAIPISYTQKAQRAAREGHMRPTGRPDVENIAKQMDAFNKLVWRDDSLIVEETIRKFFGDNPLLMVEIWRWAPPTLL
jgi:Holliday junction resolvase RusA-like endonuclease